MLWTSTFYNMNAFCNPKLKLNNLKPKLFRYYISNFCPDLYFCLPYQFPSRGNWKRKELTADILFSETFLGFVLLTREIIMKSYLTIKRNETFIQNIRCSLKNATNAGTFLCFGNKKTLFNIQNHQTPQITWHISKLYELILFTNNYKRKTVMLSNWSAE